jgi:Na+-driven multidrug efflux pump
MVISITCMWLFRVAFSYLLAPESYPVLGMNLPGFGMGVMGVWVAMIIDWGVRVVIYAWRYFSGKWLTVYDKIKE